MVRFINREYELGLLEKEWQKDKSNFVVIYGRRRIGKTRLILEFIKNKKGVYFIAEDVNKKIQIRDFKNIISEFFNDEFLRKTDINEWSILFDYLKKIIKKDENFYLIIDEFSYIVKNDHSITSTLQKFLDSFISTTKVLFIVSGSIFGLMAEKVLSSASPLYGRRTRDILLKQLSYKDSIKFLNTGLFNEFETFMCIGGIPEYLLKASEYRDFEQFANNEFLKKDGYFYREPYFLLSQEFKEIKTYFSILNAIAYGNTKPTEIANFIGIKSREIYPYLENLIRLDFVKREVSILGKRKQGIYLIKDVFFDFWFSFVYRNMNKIERGLYKVDVKTVNRYFGKQFEMLIREEMIYKIFSEKFMEFGKWWHKDKEIDIVALNEKNKEILFCECKWQNKVNSEKVIRELIEKSKYVDWNLNKRKESYAVFAKSFSKKIKDLEGKKIYCFDLKDIKNFVK